MMYTRIDGRNLQWNVSFEWHSELCRGAAAEVGGADGFLEGGLGCKTPSGHEPELPSEPVCRGCGSTNASTGECRELASCRRTSGEAQLGVSLESHDVLTSASTNVFELGAGEVVLEDLMGS